MVPLRTKELKRMRRAFAVHLRQHEAEELTKVRWSQEDPSGVKMTYFEEVDENPQGGANVEETNRDGSEPKPLRQRMVPRHQYFETLLTVHLSTNHGDVRAMRESMNPADYIPMSVIKLFPGICKICRDTAAMAAAAQAAAARAAAREQSNAAGSAAGTSGAARTSCAAGTSSGAGTSGAAGTSSGAGTSGAAGTPWGAGTSGAAGATAGPAAATSPK